MSSQFPPAVRRVMDVLEDLGPRVAVMSAMDVAERAQVSDATVIRTARLLGHKGFDGLKQASISDDWSTRAAATIASSKHDGTNVGYDRLADVARSLRHAASNSLPYLGPAVDAIDAAHRVVIGGIGPAQGISTNAALLFQRVGIAATATAATGRALADHLVTVGSTDVLMLLSYADRHPQLAAFLATANAAACPLIILGSHPPSATEATIVVPVTRGATTGLASLVPTLAVLEVLVGELMRRQPARTEAAATRLDTIRRASSAR